MIDQLFNQLIHQTQAIKDRDRDELADELSGGVCAQELGCTVMSGFSLPIFRAGAPQPGRRTMRCHKLREPSGASLRPTRGPLDGGTRPSMDGRRTLPAAAGLHVVDVLQLGAGISHRFGRSALGQLAVGFDHRGGTRGAGWSG